MIRFSRVLFIFIIFFSKIAFAQNNYITGKVVDSKTQEPLIGVNIVVNELETAGAATDIDGRFKIKVPVGSYSIKASLVGYTTVIKTDVIVRTANEALIFIRMSESTLQLNQITVRADYFDNAQKENDLSTVILGPEEVRRSPGSAQDFMRILQGMAGVSFSNDQTNELIVRGGAPDENLTIFDGMEIHSTNHYPNEYNSGGPINMINVDLIEDIQFSTGGFISKYGDKLSSVMNVTSREGTRYNLFNANLNLGMAGYGTVMEGKLNDGKGSWIFSARKSFLDLLKDAVGLTAVPRYYDMQFKVAYDLSSSQKLSWSGIYGNDKIYFDGEPEVTDKSKANTTDIVGSERVDVKQYQYAAGLTLKSLWNKNFYSFTTLYYNNYNNNVDVVNYYRRRVFDSNGKAAITQVGKRFVVNDNHNNGMAALKTEFVWQAAPNYEINFGGSIGSGDFVQKLKLLGDTTRYDINKDGRFDTTVVVNFSNLRYDIKFFSQHKDYLYVNNKFKFFNERLLLNLGLRYDYFSYSDQGNIGPRFSLSYYLLPGLTSVNFAYGDYYQSQNYPTYGDRFATEINRYLENTHARHYVLGIEHIIAEGLKLNLEGYYKKYDKIPIEEDFIYYNDRTRRSEKRSNIGEKYAYGFDLLIQQKLVKDYYGTLAFSRMWSKMKDPRIGKEGKEFSSSYDFPYVLTLIAGKRFNGFREKLDNMPFYIKYPTYILPFSDDMEFSVRWRYASGLVYTPKEFITSEQEFQYISNSGQPVWSRGTWISSDRINETRYPDYHRLDIALSSRYNYKTWSMAIYLTVENLYNRKNVAAYEYNSDGSKNAVYQFSLFPVGGIEIEF